jgi:hypothetical protein
VLIPVQNKQFVILKLYSNKRYTELLETGITLKEWDPTHVSNSRHLLGNALKYL